MSKHHESRKLQDHTNKEFTMKGEEGVWSGQEVEAQSDPLVDKGQGRPIILRYFEFKANPEVFKIEKPTKQQIFNHHAQQIKISLWKDGLEPVEAVGPRVVISKKKDSYRIFVTCQAKLGVTIIETPQTLQDLTKQNVHQPTV